MIIGIIRLVGFQGMNILRDSIMETFNNKLGINNNKVL